MTDNWREQQANDLIKLAQNAEKEKRARLSNPSYFVISHNYGATTRDEKTKSLVLEALSSNSSKTCYDNLEKLNIPTEYYNSWVYYHNDWGHISTMTTDQPSELKKLLDLFDKDTKSYVVNAYKLDYMGIVKHLNFLYPPTKPVRSISQRNVAFSVWKNRFHCSAYDMYPITKRTIEIDVHKREHFIIPFTEDAIKIELIKMRMMFSTRKHY